MSSRILARTVPLNVAEAGTDNWRQFYKFSTRTADSTQIFRGFHIPVADLRTLLEEAGDIDAVRAYFALENPYNPLVPGPAQANDIHIYLVPVKDNVDICEDPEGNSNVCDFTTPCPKICDTSSPLFSLLTMND